jgi:WD40 repeat protein
VVSAVAFSPDGTRLLAGDSSGAAAVYDTESGRRLFGLVGHTAADQPIAYTRSFIVTGSLDNTVRVWDAGTGALLRTISFPGFPGWGSAARTGTSMVVAESTGALHALDICSGCGDPRALLAAAAPSTRQQLLPEERVVLAAG